MKLWLKQTLICLLVIMLAFCACLYFFVVQQTQQMLDDAQNSALQNTNVFCEHLATLDRTSNTGYGTDETTLRALIQYTFSSYAHLLQSKNISHCHTRSSEISRTNPSSGKRRFCLDI